VTTSVHTACSDAHESPNNRQGRNKVIPGCRMSFMNDSTYPPEPTAKWHSSSRAPANPPVQVRSSRASAMAPWPLAPPA
jgi:hypothetical protein